MERRLLPITQSISTCALCWTLGYDTIARMNDLRAVIVYERTSASKQIWPTARCFIHGISTSDIHCPHPFSSTYHHHPLGVWWVARDRHRRPWGFIGLPMPVPEKNCTWMLRRRKFMGMGMVFSWVPMFLRVFQVTGFQVMFASYKKTVFKTQRMICIFHTLIKSD